MTTPECIRVFDSQGEAYKQAFQIFLATQTRSGTLALLKQVVDDLPIQIYFPMLLNVYRSRVWWERSICLGTPYEQALTCLEMGSRMAINALRREGESLLKQIGAKHKTIPPAL